MVCIKIIYYDMVINDNFLQCLVSDWHLSKLLRLLQQRKRKNKKIINDKNYL